jgi:tetratricopeptide (TPR) repeat protein
MRKFLPPLEEAYREALRLQPGLAEPEYLMGRMHRALLDERRALDFQEKALAKDPAYAPALYERAVLLSMRHARETKETLDALQGESVGDPMENPESDLAELRDRIVKDAKAFLATRAGGVEAIVAQGLLAAHTKRFAEARAFFDEALRKDPQLEEARGALAAMVWSEIAPGVEDRERKWKKAEEVYTQGLARDQGYVPHYLGRGQLRWNRGSARRHRGLDPAPDYESAEADFSRAVELDPGSVEAWTWRGQARVYLGIFAIESGKDPRAILARAEEDESRALSIDGTYARAWLWRGNARFYRGTWLSDRGQDPMPDFEGSEVDLTEAIRTAQVSENEPRWRGRMRAQRAAALGRAGRDVAPQFEAALSDFLDSEKARTPDMWHWVWRSTVFSERALWRRSRGEDPKEDFALAESDLEKSLKLNRHFGEAWKHRGFVRWNRAETLEKAGDRDGARENYAAAAADFHEALSINANFRVQVGDRVERARRKASELRD